jgi:hypothetical protein
MFARRAALVALALAGCQGESRRPAEEPQATPAAAAAASVSTAADETPAIRDASTLVGEYRVAGVDGREVGGSAGHVVSISPSAIEFMHCAGFAWTYAFVDGVLRKSRIPASPEGIICRPTPEAARIGQALAAANRVGRTPANGLEFSGRGRSVLLFSQ